MFNKRQRILKAQSNMNNPEKMATQDKQNEDKQNKRNTQDEDKQNKRNTQDKNMSDINLAWLIMTT